MLILNSERMVLLHLKYKILCAWFLSHHSYSDFIYHVIEIPTSYLNFEIQKLSKEPWSSEIILTNITFRNKGSAFSVSKLKMKHDKNTEKSFLRENKFHTYLTRETLPAEERLGNFYNHGKTPSYQTSADASMRKFMPKSCDCSLKKWTRRLLFVLWLGPSVTIILVKIVSRSRENYSNNMADGAIYGRKLDLC